MKYLVILEPTSNGFSAYSPDLDGCAAAAGDEREQTIALMQEAIEFHLEGLAAIGQIPNALRVRPVAAAVFLPLIAMLVQTVRNVWRIEERLRFLELADQFYKNGEYELHRRYLDRVAALRNQG